MPTNTIIPPTTMPGKTDLSSSATTLDLSIKSSLTKLSQSPERQMSSTSSSAAAAKAQKSSLLPKAPTPTTDPGGGSTTDSDEVKVFGCEKHEEDVDIDGDASSDRLSPVVKEEESSPQQTSSTSLADRLNSEHQLHSFFPYFISPYYHAAAAGSATPPFDKMAPLGSLSKFMSPPPAHLSSASLGIDPNTGVPSSIYPLSSPSSFQSLYAQHWRPPMFPFVFPPGYPFSPSVLSQGSSAVAHTAAGHLSSASSHGHNPSAQKRSAAHRSMEHSPQHPQQHHKFSVSHEEHKPKKPHIKKPLNAFMLFMKEQRAQVVQECTLRESAAINQILGRKWHELDRNVQQKYYDMARDERMKHMQLYPGWSARDNYGSRKKRGSKGKKREKSQGENGDCLNQKKCRARFGLDQQSNWCKHCKRKKKCLRYTEDESACAGPNSVGGGSWSEDDDTDNNDEDSEDGMDHCDIPMMAHSEGGNLHESNRNLRSPHHGGISVDSDEENKSRILMHQQPPNSNGSGSSSSTNGAVPLAMLPTGSASRKDSSSSSTSPQMSFIHSSHHRYPIGGALPPPHFHPAHHPYFEPFLPPTPMPLLNGLKRET